MLFFKLHKVNRVYIYTFQISLYLYAADFSPPKRTISQRGELRKEYEEELRKVKILLDKF